jgi:hypothetical protein
MELSIGSKTLATDFFVVEVQGSYNLILGCNWIHVNWYVPSSLHQRLIQWVDDEVELSLRTHRPKLPQPVLLCLGVLLVFINAHRNFCKHTDTVIAFTREYSRVSNLSTGKQWLKRLIIHHHVSTNLIHQLN